MNIKRFFGKNSREALSLVRKELGEDAVILSNRAINGGNEIMAFKEEDMHSMMQNDTGDAAVDNAPAPSNLKQESRPSNYNSNEPTTLLSLIHSNRAKLAAINENKPEASAAKMSHEATINHAEKHDSQKELTQAVNGHHLTGKQSTSQESNLKMTEMLSEMRDMRSVIESQLTTISWGNIQQRDPSKSSILNTLLSAGFSAALSRQLAEKMPENLSTENATAWIKSILTLNLNTIENDAEVLDQGGIFALIGPTGVGKTTTTAKLAARYVMKHGTENLGIITTDAYRIGGHEQLRIYGKILGVMVHAVKDEADLKIALNELKNKHTILIDTVGVSQRDRMVAEQIAMLSNTNMPIKKLLCLNATNTGETLIDVITAYKGKGLDGCIITKLDEAATIGNALDVIIREKIKLYYVANGQRVPEDIHLANKQYLVQHALKLSSTSNRAFQYLNEELPFIMGNTVNTTNAAQLAGISYA